jgi:hypothetical protein
MRTSVIGIDSMERRWDRLASSSIQYSMPELECSCDIQLEVGPTIQCLDCEKQFQPFPSTGLASRFFVERARMPFSKKKQKKTNTLLEPEPNEQGLHIW